MAGIALTPVALALSSTPAAAQPPGTTETSTPSSSANPAVVGQPITLSATVTADDGGTPTGTVDFSDAGGVLCTGTLDQLSPDVASCTYTPTSANAADGISATYSGDVNYQSSSSPAPLSQEVDMDGTATALGVSPGSPVVGQSVTLNATVTADAPGSGTPTGTVTFSGNAGTLCGGPVALSGGTASCSVSYPAVTTDNFTANYSGDSNFTSSSGSSSVTVGQASTSTVISPSDAAPVVGEQVTYTATVSVNPPGAGTPTGTVDFSGNAGTICSAVPLSGSTATCTTSYAAPGSDSVSATYSGDSNFFGSSSASTSVTIGPDTTTTGAAATPSSAVVGQTVTLSATVAVAAPGAGTPTGTVTFSDAGGPLCSATLNASSPDVASCTYTPSAVTSGDTITASYGGDTNDNASSGTTSVTVGQDATTTIASAAPSSVVTGQSVMLSATVAVSSPGAGTPTGTVSFSDASGTLCSATLNASSPDVASCTYAPSATTSGDTITANYGGDTSDATSSATTTVSVGMASTTTAVSATASPVVGQAVIYTATVSAVAPGSGNPTGLVTFTQGTTTLCSSVPLSATSPDTATCSHSYASPATVSVKAAYSGDGNYSSSAGTKSETISKGSVTQTLSSSANPTVTGQQFIVTDTIGAAAPAQGTPSGTVTFHISTAGVIPQCQGSDTVVIASGNATCILSGLNPSQSPLSVSASYIGDSNFNAGTTSSPLVETINKANPAISITSTQNPVVTGGAVSFTATISAASPGSSSGATPSVPPTWTITGTHGATVSCASTSTGTSGTDETATCNVASGQLVYATTPYTVKVSYPGDANYNSGSKTYQENVTLGTSFVGLKVSPPAAAGGTASFTATVTGTPASLGTPTGTVRFVITDKLGNQISCAGGTNTLPLSSSGQATCTTGPLSHSRYFVYATYSGSSVYFPNTSKTKEFRVL
jgi:hypothetical protein